MKIKSLVAIIVFGVLFFSHSIIAQEQISTDDIDYGDQPAIDSDLDGLTDQGEIKIYHTDPNNADTDGDGFSDGVEVTAASDPLDSNSYPGAPSQILAAEQSPKAETPWAWYVSRMSALVGFTLLYISIFLGLAIRIPILKMIISPVYSLSAHRWISLQATIFALIHGVALMFDKTFNFSLAAILVPAMSPYEPLLVAMGVVTFYLMVILVATSYGRKYISQTVWRATHSLNILLYIFGIIHAIKLGTDFKDPLFMNIFIWANAFLIIIFLYNVELRMSNNMRIKAEKKLREQKEAEINS